MALLNSPYKQSSVKTVLRDAKPVVATYSDANMQLSNHDPRTGSFKYDPLGSPLKSTQQLNLDWSKFENHCFFSSAEVRVNEAFDKIINFYPFDGTKVEVEEFLDSLTGFEKWIFDRFPKWSGALHFSGTQVGESGQNGTFVSVRDKSGYLYPELAKNNSGNVVLNPQDATTSMTFESLVFLPEQVNDTQVIFQKQNSSTEGLTFYLKPSGLTNSAEAVFCLSSGALRNAVSGTLQKGRFNHVCLTVNKDVNRLQFYVDQSLASQSSVVKFPKLEIDNSDLIIGSGSSFYSFNNLIVPTQTLSGTIDEFRVFHSKRDTATQALNITRGIYPTPDLKLYYRFNEPADLSNNSTPNSIVLDSSGNSLHASVNNFTSSLRFNMKTLFNNVMKYERKEFQVVLFPAYQDVITLNQELLLSASSYDSANPNNIIRLVPPHYLLEGAAKDGFDNSTVEGDGGSPYGGDGIPGQGKKGSVQMILSFLYIWSRFFDEIKTFIDAFSSLRTVGQDYNEENTIPDNFLEDIVSSYGLYLPRFFTHASVEQFAEGQNIEGLTDIDTPLKKIQAALTRRVLINLPYVVRSKGTHYSIRTFLRSVGIDPDNSVKIREYGGPTTSQILTAREKRSEFIPFVDFTDSQSAYITTTYLSASRVEPGYPEPAGTFLYDSVDTHKRIGTTNSADGLFTSGSWNVEALFKITKPNESDTPSTQSLMRVMTTGSTPSSLGLLANVVATKPAYEGDSSKLTAYLRPSDNAAISPVLQLNLNLDTAGLFDGNKWNVSFGCFRNDDIGSSISSSYYLRAGRVEQGEIIESYVTSSYFYEKASSENNLFRQINSSYNPSGSFISIGPGVSVNPSLSFPFLNNSLAVDSEARTTDFTGLVSSLRFWTKGMSLEEWKERVRNPKSVGVSDPRINYNFVKNVSGSFEKLRLETLLKQPIKAVDATGKIEFLDFSLNNLTSSVGQGFTSGSTVLIGDLMSYSHLSTRFDEASSDDKIRIRSFNNPKNVDENSGSSEIQYSTYESYLKEEPKDDLRLSVEFSMIESLSKDMANMFSSYDIFNDMIGSPELMFSSDYPNLEVLRDVYFNRLSGKPDFKKFFEFYRWFDISMSGFIEQLLPAKTRYKGTNFVVESHLLERHKHMYRHDQNYLGKKRFIQDSLRVQQIVGNLRKY